MKKILTCFLCILSALVLVNVTPAYAVSMYYAQVDIQTDDTVIIDADVSVVSTSDDSITYTLSYKSGTIKNGYYTAQYYDQVPYGSYNAVIVYNNMQCIIENCNVTSNGVIATVHYPDDFQPLESSSGDSDSTESTEESSESTETTEEPSEVVEPVSVDMTETNSKLDKIHAVLLMILVIILFNVAYEFIKKTIGKGA